MILSQLMCTLIDSILSLLVQDINPWQPHVQPQVVYFPTDDALAPRPPLEPRAHPTTRDIATGMSPFTSGEQILRRIVDNPPMFAELANDIDLMRSLVQPDVKF